MLPVQSNNLQFQEGTLRWHSLLESSLGSLAAHSTFHTSQLTISVKADSTLHDAIPTLNSSGSNLLHGDCALAHSTPPVFSYIHVGRRLGRIRAHPL